MTTPDEHACEAAEPSSADPGRPFAGLRDSGLLWLINRVVFHPRGFAFALHTDHAGKVTGWSLLGDGSEPWTFPRDVDQEGHRLAEASLDAARGGAMLVPWPHKAMTDEEVTRWRERWDAATHASGGPRELRIATPGTGSAQGATDDSAALYDVETFWDTPGGPPQWRPEARWIQDLETARATAQRLAAENIPARVVRVTREVIA